MRDFFLMNHVGVKYVLYSGMYTMEFISMEIARDYKSINNIDGYIVIEK